MNSVALPTTASAPTLSAEGDLIRQAARGEAEAFAELFRRHGQMAWRLAQAVAVDREAAIAAVGNGFARSLRGARRRADAAGGYRPLVLSAVYRSAMEDARAQASKASPTMPSPAGSGAGRAARSKAKAKGADAVLVNAAFRSLPERWRAALWLSEVEAMTTDSVAPILGVSTAVAAQLTTRGARGFAGRFAQARRPVPEHLGPPLREVGLAVPANLEDVVASRVKSPSSDPAQRFAPVTDWIGERATRPLQMAVGGLLALGLIGVGLVGQGSSVPAGPVALSASPAGTNPQVSQSFFPGNSGAGAQAGSFNFSSDFTNAASGALGASGGSLAGGSAAGGSGATSSSAPSSDSTGASPGGSLIAAPGSTSLSTPGGTGTGTPSAPQPKSIVSLAPVATVTQSGNSTTVNALPSSSGTAASVTVCKNGIEVTTNGVPITLAGKKVACTSPATTTPLTTAPLTVPPTTLPIVGGL